MAFREEARRRIAELETTTRAAAALDGDRAAARDELEAAEAAVGTSPPGRRARPCAPPSRSTLQRPGHAARPASTCASARTRPGEDVTWLLGANPGEPLLPLAKVASGGELARAMLAVRLVLTERRGPRSDGPTDAPGRATRVRRQTDGPQSRTIPPTLVFDEVDAGIGGEAAVAVGRALAALGARHQVLVVTHLPQVAAFADRHLVVRKEASGERTVASVEEVDGPARVVELSRMLSGRPDSATARRHAEELLAPAVPPVSLHRGSATLEARIPLRRSAARQGRGRVRWPTGGSTESRTDRLEWRSVLAKHIFVTGGVTSSLGKGLAASSLGRLLKSRGLRVTMQKLDPYINVDPGTMNPFEHGEVFVTDDGGETDLDLGHYERFIDENLHRESNATTGSIYQSVIAKERRGDFLGKTVQVIPHITDEIKDRIKRLATDSVDVVITEVGGTVGDIEILPFLEAIRQFRKDVGRDNVCYVHVTLVPYLGPSGEQKTKPTQHSVTELRSRGIQPDVIICRSDRSISSALKRKISLLSDVPMEAVVSCMDAPNLYEIPLALHEEGLDTYVCRLLGFEAADDDGRPATPSTCRPGRRWSTGSRRPPARCASA